MAFKVEYDSPQALLQKKGGYFKMLVDGSGDRKALYAAVERKADEQFNVGISSVISNIDNPQVEKAVTTVLQYSMKT